MEGKERQTRDRLIVTGALTHPFLYSVQFLHYMFSLIRKGDVVLELIKLLHTVHVIVSSCMTLFVNGHCSCQASICSSPGGISVLLPLSF